MSHIKGIFLVIGFLLFSSIVSAQQTAPSKTIDAASPDAVTISEKAPPAVLTYMNRDIFTFRAVVVNNPPEARAARALERLNGLRYEDIKLQELQVVNLQGNYLVFLGSRNLFAITPKDLDPESTETMDQVTAKVTARLKEAFQVKIQQLSVPFLLKAAGLSVGATVLFVIVWVLIFRLRRKVISLFEKKAEERKEKFQVLGFDFKEKAFSLLRLIVFYVVWMALILAAYTWITFVLSQFPYSQPWAQKLDDFFWARLNHLFLNFVHALPGLATVALIFVLARFITRLVTDFFKGVETGRVAAPDVFAETSSATRRMANALIDPTYFINNQSLLF